MRVFVTGAAGFTGRYVCDALRADGHEVTALQGDLLRADDVLDEVRAAAPDAVVHLAANAFAGASEAMSFYPVNLIGSIALLEAVASVAPSAHVVMASTANLYDAVESGVLSEDHPVKPRNHYAHSKWLMERACAFWAERLAITIVRPFNYTGVGQSEAYLVPKIVGHFRRGERAIALGNLTSARDFGDVRHVARAYAGLVQRPPASRVLNVCTGQALTVREIVTMVERLAGYEIEVMVNTDLVRAGEISSLVGDNARLKREMPTWEPIAIEQTIAWMFASDDVTP